MLLLKNRSNVSLGRTKRKLPPDSRNSTTAHGEPIAA